MIRCIPKKLKHILLPRAEGAVTYPTRDWVMLLGVALIFFSAVAFFSTSFFVSHSVMVAEETTFDARLTARRSARLPFGQAEDRDQLGRVITHFTDLKLRHRALQKNPPRMNDPSVPRSGVLHEQHVLPSRTNQTNKPEGETRQEE